jgi:hypothetical protein
MRPGAGVLWVCVSLCSACDRAPDGAWAATAYARFQPIIAQIDEAIRTDGADYRPALDLTRLSDTEAVLALGKQRAARDLLARTLDKLQGWPGVLRVRLWDPTGREISHDDPTFVMRKTLIAGLDGGAQMDERSVGWGMVSGVNNGKNWKAKLLVVAYPLLVGERSFRVEALFRE